MPLFLFVLRGRILFSKSLLAFLTKITCFFFSSQLVLTFFLVTLNMWSNLTNLTHLEISDFPPFECGDCSETCSCSEDSEFESFFLNFQALNCLTNLRVLEIGRDRAVANIFSSFEFFPELRKLSYFLNPYDENQGHQRVFECTDEEKALGKGRIKWSKYIDLSEVFFAERLRYEGEVNKEYHMSRGVLYYREDNYLNLERFEGEFEFDVEDTGKLYFKNGEILDGIFRNENIFVDEERGVICRSNGDRYEGEINENGEMHGNGVISYLGFSRSSNMLKFEGKFKNDVEKVGVVYFTNGDRYEGLFCHSFTDRVRGKIFFHNGDIYEGEVKHFEMDGRGKIIYANGREYEGKFKNNKPRQKVNSEEF